MRTMLFNPYTGRPRDPRDIASDPAGTLMVDPDEPLRPAGPAAGCQCPACATIRHTSDCAVHNAPAYPVGPCTCTVLVPREATREMMRAAVVFANGNAVYKNVAAGALEIEEQIYGEAYAAMIAAAPAAQAQGAA